MKQDNHKACTTTTALRLAWCILYLSRDAAMAFSHSHHHHHHHHHQRRRWNNNAAIVQVRNDVDGASSGPGSAPYARHGHTQGPLHMSGSGSISSSQSQLLSLEEETELLRASSEYKRIREVQQKLPQNKLRDYPQANLARETGYDSVSELESAMDAGQRARDRLVMMNINLVRAVVNKVAKQRRLNSLTREDLVQEGVIGLSRAVDKFDFERTNGARFSTYATYWIRAAVLRVIAEKDDFIRAPEHVSSAIKRLGDAAQRIGVDLTEFTSKAAWQEAKAAKELAEAAGLTTGQLERAVTVADRRRRGGYVEMKPFLEPGFKGVVEEASFDGKRHSASDDLHAIFSCYLLPKEMQVLGLRYGIGLEPTAGTIDQPSGFRDYQAEAEEYLFQSTGQQANSEFVTRGRSGEEMSFKEVGKRIGISGEYCRRLCAAALEKLRQAAEDGRLDPAFLC